jgi:hypothetical protein
MPINPFNDAPVPQNLGQGLRPNPGVVTKNFDVFRQGESLTSNPTLQRGTVNFTGKNSGVEGQTVRSDFSPVFDATQAANNLNYAQIKSFDGVIEPFTIRYITTFNPIFGRLVKHSIKGHLCMGNSKLFGGSDIAQQVMLLTKLQISSSLPFIDLPNVYNLRTIGPSAMLSEPQPVNNNANTIRPFDTLQDIHNVKLSNSMGTDMKNALLQMKPASSTLIPINHVSARAGFVYDNILPWVQGTDSLAFGFDY